MIIPDMYFIEDVKALENKILLSQGFKKTKTHFNEQIALHLWNTWNNNQTIENRDNFLLILYPLITKLINPFIRFIEDESYGLQYEDIFQSTLIKAIEILPKYSPTRINKSGTTSRIFTYFTLILQYHLKTITAKEYKYYKARTSLSGTQVKSSDASVTLQDFCLFCASFARRKNLRPKHKEIYQHLSVILLSDNIDLSQYANNLNSILSIQCKTTIKDVESALRLIRKAYGQPKITNTDLYIPDNDYNNYPS